ncbi:MAG TPA: hypothetical protein VN150_04800 [Ochrobactrum sp.]|nr:hypothetical protein [Ochrobactrum sp.]
MSDNEKEHLTKDTLFKSNPSRMEAKNATTDKAARAILQSERDAVDAKTARLRAARLSRDQAE